MKKHLRCGIAVLAAAALASPVVAFAAVLPPVGGGETPVVDDENAATQTLDSAGAYSKHLCGMNGTVLGPQESCPGLSPRHSWRWAIAYRNSGNTGKDMCMVVKDKTNRTVHFSRCSFWSSSIYAGPSDFNYGRELTRVYNKNNNVTMGEERRYAYADTNGNGTKQTGDRATLPVLATILAAQDTNLTLGAAQADSQCFDDATGGFCTPNDKIGQDFGVSCFVDGRMTVAGFLAQEAVIRLRDGATVPVAPGELGTIDVAVPDVPVAVEYAGQRIALPGCAS